MDRVCWEVGKTLDHSAMNSTNDWKIHVKKVLQRGSMFLCLSAVRTEQRSLSCSTTTLPSAGQGLCAPLRGAGLLSRAKPGCFKGRTWLGTAPVLHSAGPCHGDVSFQKLSCFWRLSCNCGAQLALMLIISCEHRGAGHTKMLSLSRKLKGLM